MGKSHKAPPEMLECGLPVALEVMGERWSFMILRAAFNGLAHFEDFLTEMGIARNILSNRLAKLVDHGIMKREAMPEDRRRIEYRLTEKGLDLLPALLALRQWGEKYNDMVQANPVLVDAQDRLPIAPIVVHSHDGRPLTVHELRWQHRDKLGDPKGGFFPPDEC